MSVAEKPNHSWNQIPPESFISVRRIEFTDGIAKL